MGRDFMEKEMSVDAGTVSEVLALGPLVIGRRSRSAAVSVPAMREGPGHRLSQPRSLTESESANRIGRDAQKNEQQESPWGRSRKRGGELAKRDNLLGENQFRQKPKMCLNLGSNAGLTFLFLRRPKLPVSVNFLNRDMDRA